MYYNVKICRSDRFELENLLDKYIKRIGKQMVESSFMDCGELRDIITDFDLIIKFREALASAEEIPHGKE